jgi:thiamine kinase-like enzyme
MEVMQKKMKKISIGQSGADVFELNESQILKHVVRERIKNGMFDTYVREALFYQSECPKAYLPEVSDVQISEDEIVLVMKKYRNLDRNDFNDELLKAIAGVLAGIHSETVPEFVIENDIRSNEMSENEISDCVKGWHSVLDEHPGKFDGSLIDVVSVKINDIIKWHDSEIRHLSHGDFHWDNLLTDDNGRIIVCDWQGVGLRGASDDLSFFISRLGADGISVDAHTFLTWYAIEYNRLTGENIEADDLEKHIKAANVITSFRFWHLYLHGNDTERVREIYDKMMSDYKDIQGC